MLPLLQDRPVTMIRYPDGIAAHSILQKNAPGLLPGLGDPRRGAQAGRRSVHHVICDKPATLAYLANQACVELHVFLSRTRPLDRPDQLIFDLDPPDDGPLRRGARGPRGCCASCWRASWG